MRFLLRLFVLSLSLLLNVGAASAQYTWQSLRGAPSNGSKQDGIWFIHPDTGWVVNGSGRIYRTLNGGTTWVQQRNSPGTYFRAVRFVNGQLGFAGNIGPGYFPGVTDTSILYRTNDGGNSWVDCTPTITGTVPAGICAIDAPTPQVIYAGGRVGSPAVIIKSTDGGLSWEGIDMPSICKMILDIHFTSADTGFVFAGTNANIAFARALVMRTTDGGQNWTEVYRGTRSYEILWKASFPSRRVGYASVQSYSSTSNQRYVIKTEDGGATWTEQLFSTQGVRTFGIGFVNDSVGWMGAENTGYETRNGGRTWISRNIGQYANKICLLPDGQGGQMGYAVGLSVYKLTENRATALAPVPTAGRSQRIYPNPAQSGGDVSLSLEGLPGRIVRAELVQLGSGRVYPLFQGFYKGTEESPFYFRLPVLPAGAYVARFYDEGGKAFSQKLQITAD